MSADDNAWLQSVRHTAADPNSWWMQARTLRQAAEDLWNAGNAHDREPGSELGAKVLAKWTAPGFVPPLKGGSTFEVCIMLLGFALENLAKGVIVARDPSVVRKKQLRKWHGGGHDLVGLFRRADIAFSDGERATLARTTRITEWKGRYPVPINFHEVGGQDRVIGYVAVSNVWPVDEFSCLCSLYDRAKAILDSTIESTPALPPDYDFR
jgi:hypothetical protein